MASSPTSKIILTVVLFAIISIVLIFTLIKPVSIDGSSMQPNYMNGDRYIALKQIHRIVPPKQGDVIMFTLPRNENYRFVSRIIGLPGEQIRIEDGDVYINNSILTEEYLEPGTRTETQEGLSISDTSATTGTFVPSTNVDVLEEGETTTIPEDSYFVLCDNRGNAIDSRNFGFIEKSGIIGKLVFQY